MNKILEKIYPIEEAIYVVSEWKEKGETVVFTNGCFDILHYGHVSYLYEAREMGIRLVVALNSGDSIKRLKGNDRPVNNLVSRMSVLASLEYVDIVIPFGEDTPITIIKELLPNILVKGADYKAKDIVGYDTVIESGGSVQTIEFQKGYSVTNIVDKVKK